MSGYVIKNADTGKFVAQRGSDRSYTGNLQHVRVFRSRGDAENDKCGNETIVPLENLIPQPS
jgi:hypothetical protein